MAFIRSLNLTLGPAPPPRQGRYLPHGPQRPLQLFHGRAVWAFHCHNLYHMAAGMFATLVYRGFGQNESG